MDNKQHNPKHNYSESLDENEIPSIALVGQPNLGKSTRFNLLTGLNQHVGNWPGKTVELRKGNFTLDSIPVELVDLPGTYSLTANSPEELVAREFIIREKPAVVIAVVSAANLEHSLYLVAELLALQATIVVALNMVDVAEQEGISIDVQTLSAALGLPVIPMVASKAIGVKDLLAEVSQVMKSGETLTPNAPHIRADHQEVMRQMSALIANKVPEAYPQNWIALKLLEGDTEVTRMMQKSLTPEAYAKVEELLREHDDAYMAVASGRYDWINRLLSAAMRQRKIGTLGLTSRLDRWATHPFWGLLILGLILGLVYWLTFAIGSPIQAWLDEKIMSPLGALASVGLQNAPAWFSSMIVDGIIGGVGSVITFLPILVIFFAAFAFLEDVGYMARAAYMMDKFMHIMGLHGKSFLPLFLGFGCNVPAIIGTRVIDTWSSRLVTILIAPFVPCATKMAVVAFLASAFFGKNALWVMLGMLALSMLALVISGLLLNRTIFKGQRSSFIMEMPLYHQPNLRTILLDVWQHSKSFLRKAGGVILIMMLIVWILSYLPNGDLDSSYLASFGRFLEPFGKWMGFDWRLLVAMITSFPAKENTIATLGVLMGSTEGAGLAEMLAANFSTASALSFLVVIMLFIPCLATVAVQKQETKSWGWTLFGIGLMLTLSIVGGVSTYQLAQLVGL